jgi:hypothetical protein
LLIAELSCGEEGDKFVVEASLDLEWQLLVLDFIEPFRPFCEARIKPRGVSGVEGEEWGGRSVWPKTVGDRPSSQL